MLTNKTTLEIYISEIALDWIHELAVIKYRPPQGNDFIIDIDACKEDVSWTGDDWDEMLKIITANCDSVTKEQLVTYGYIHVKQSR